MMQEGFGYRCYIKKCKRPRITVEFLLWSYAFLRYRTVQTFIVLAYSVMRIVLICIFKIDIPEAVELIKCL